VCLFGGASARDLDGRYADSSPTRLSPPVVTFPRSQALDIAPTLVDHLLQHEFAGSGLVARRVQVFQSVLCDPESFLYYSHNIFLMEITTERSSMEITTDQSFCGECEVVFGYDDIGDRELLTQEFDL
jgi:hypothetical protein